MQEPDLSNPLVAITGFFGVLGTSILFILKIVPFALASGGILVGIGALIGATALIFKIMLGQD